MERLTLENGEEMDVSAFPLPEGIEDVVLNRGQLAKAMNVSEVTITNWQTDGLPVRQHGGNGQAYEFQLSHCFAWRQHREQAEVARRKHGDAMAQQMALTFLNPDEVDNAVPQLTAKQVKEWADAEYARNRTAELRGDLVRASMVAAVLEQLLVDVRNAVNVIPDFCEQEFGLSAAQASNLQDRCDAVIEEMAVTIHRNNSTGGEVVNLPAGSATG